MCYIFKGKTGIIITFAQFEEGGLIFETPDDDKSSDKSDDDSIMPPLLNEEEIDAKYSGDESDDEPMSTDMLEDIRDGGQSHTSINRG